MQFLRVEIEFFAVYRPTRKPHSTRATRSVSPFSLRRLDYHHLPFLPFTPTMHSGHCHTVHPSRAMDDQHVPRAPICAPVLVLSCDALFPSPGVQARLILTRLACAFPSPASHLPRTVRYEPRAQPANLNLSCQPGTAPLSPTRDGLAVRSAKVEWSGVGACKPFIITHRQTPILHTGYVHHANSIRAAMFSILPGNCTWRIAHADIGPCCA
jgi:hypothetical protein